MNTPDRAPASLTSRIAIRRRAMGIQQNVLAERVGVSRQFLSQLEAGKTQPNVQVALQLASELQCSVEDLFESLATRKVEGVEVSLMDQTLSSGTRLDLARIGERWVAYSADTASSLGSGFSDADAVLAKDEQGISRALLHRSNSEVEGNLAVAGCDPALALLRSAAAGQINTSRCFWINCGSSRALQLLQEGWVHAAGLHYEGADDDENLRRVRAVDPSGQWELFRFTRWEQGWMLRRELTDRFHGAGDLAGGKLRLANRELGSGSRHWLDMELGRAGVQPSKVAGYSTVLLSHWECARALTDGRADVAVGQRAIATAFNLAFVPFSVVAFDLVVPKAYLGMPRLQVLLNRLRSRAFQRELETLAGYSAIEAGSRRG